MDDEISEVLEDPAGKLARADARVAEAQPETFGDLCAPIATYTVVCLPSGYRWVGARKSVADWPRAPGRAITSSMRLWLVAWRAAHLT